MVRYFERHHFYSITFLIILLALVIIGAVIVARNQTKADNIVNSNIDRQLPEAQDYQFQSNVINNTLPGE